MALKSPAASANWAAVERVFERTLTSVCNQSDPDYRVIVVCNRVPELKAPVPDRVEFLVRDLPVPDVKAREETMQDKWTKLAHGLVAAGALRPDFVMLMDADDFVSRRLAAFANAHKSSHGWIFKRAYNWREGSRFMELSDQFNCGTNAIVSARLIHFPQEVSEAERRKCVILQHGHTRIDEAMRELGTPLEPLPFPGAVWVAGHGDNWTSLQGEDGMGRWPGFRSVLGSVRRARFFSSSLKAEFGLAGG